MSRQAKSDEAARRFVIGSCLWMVLSLTAVEGRAQAQTPPPDDAAASVDARFRQGLSSFEAGAFDAAAEVWEALLVELGPDRGWKLNYNLGLAYHAAGRPTLALERFEAFTARVAAETSALPAEFEQRREDAAAKVRDIQSSHAALRLPATSPGVLVRVDGEPARAPGHTLYVPPGRHMVEVIGPHGDVRHQGVEVLAGRQQTFDTSDPTPPTAPLVPLAAPHVDAPRAASAPMSPDADAPTFPTMWVVIGGGATALSFILPAVLLDRAGSKRDEAEALGPGHTAYADAKQGFEEARTAYELSYALPAALGAITLVVATVGLVRIATYEPSATAQRVTVDVSLGTSAGTGGVLWFDARL